MGTEQRMGVRAGGRAAPARGERLAPPFWVPSRRGMGGEGFHDAPVPSPDLSPPFPCFPLSCRHRTGAGGGCLCERGDGGPAPPGNPCLVPSSRRLRPRGTKKGEGRKGESEKVRSSSSRPPPAPDTRPPVRLLSPSPIPLLPRFRRGVREGCGRGAGGGRRRGGFDGGRGGAGDGMGRPIPRYPPKPVSASRRRPQLPQNPSRPAPTPTRPWPPPPPPSSCPSLRKFPRRTHAHIIQSLSSAGSFISYLTKADPDVKAAAPPTTRAAMAAVSFIWGWGAVLVRCDVCCCGSMEDRAWWGSGNGRGAETGRDGQRGRGAEQRLMRGGGGASGERGGGGKGGTGRGPFGLASLPR